MQKDFSYVIDIDNVSSGENEYFIKADRENLDFLTELLGVQKVNSFSAEFKTKLDRKKGLLDIKGRVKASVELQSVISLENFSKNYNVVFDVNYSTKPKHEECKEEIEYDFDEDIVEEIVDGKVDLVSIAIEQLSLQIEDYPKKKGESFSFKSEFSEEDKPNPFAVLAKLKK